MKKVKKIAALIGVILILSMYIISFISAIFASEHATGLFISSVFCTIAIPILLYGFILVYKRVHKDEVVVDAFHKTLPDMSKFNTDITDTNSNSDTRNSK